jgi:hypothetical protein
VRRALQNLEGKLLLFSSSWKKVGTVDVLAWEKRSQQSWEPPSGGTVDHQHVHCKASGGKKGERREREGRATTTV